MHNRYHRIVIKYFIRFVLSAPRWKFIAFKLVHCPTGPFVATVEVAQNEFHEEGRTNMYSNIKICTRCVSKGIHRWVISSLLLKTTCFIRKNATLTGIYSVNQIVSVRSNEINLFAVLCGRTVLADVHYAQTLAKHVFVTRNPNNVYWPDSVRISHRSRYTLGTRETNNFWTRSIYFRRIPY